MRQRAKIDHVTALENSSTIVFPLPIEVSALLYEITGVDKKS
jgi:hypothetical protein